MKRLCRCNQKYISKQQFSSNNAYIVYAKQTITNIILTFQFWQYLASIIQAQTLKKRLVHVYFDWNPKLHFTSIPTFAAKFNNKQKRCLVTGRGKFQQNKRCCCITGKAKKNTIVPKWVYPSYLEISSPVLVPCRRCVLRNGRSELRKGCFLQKRDGRSVLGRVPCCENELYEKKGTAKTI